MSEHPSQGGGVPGWVVRCVSEKSMREMAVSLKARGIGYQLLNDGTRALPCAKCGHTVLVGLEPFIEAEASHRVIVPVCEVCLPNEPIANEPKREKSEDT